MVGYATVQLLSMHCLQKHHFVVQIASKTFEDFLTDDRSHQVFPQLKHDFFLMVFRQLKYCGFKLSSLIWKLYLQHDLYEFFHISIINENSLF
jgi:hypothetical protein